jgi:hypothetical protein
MTFLAVHGAESYLAIVTASTEFALVYLIHLHARCGFFEFEDSRMAVVACEHRCMKLVAEDGRIQTGGGIRKLFLECSHLMASCAVCRGEGLPAVMTASAGFSLIHQVHGYLRSTFFHGEEFGMTFTAGIFLSMVQV